MKRLLLFTVAVLAASCSGADKNPLLMNERKIDGIIAGMSLEEKVAMLHAKTNMSSEGIPRLGIQEIRYTNGPFGIREENGDGFRPLGWTTDSATYFPTGSALAATWSKELAYKYGNAMGKEAHLRGNIRHNSVCQATRGRTSMTYSLSVHFYKIIFGGNARIKPDFRQKC